jgi:hypothetical protein
MACKYLETDIIFLRMNRRAQVLYIYKHIRKNVTSRPRDPLAFGIARLYGSTCVQNEQRQVC